MLESWRWFGPEDPVSLADMRQAGARGVVTALHSHYTGEVWPETAIAARRREIEAAGLDWAVVESIPVPDAIKRGDDGAEAATRAFCETMRRVAAAGVRVICYNFMPVVDWTRTHLAHPMPSGGLALRFEKRAFIAYDVFVLKRPGAAGDYPDQAVAKAEEWLAGQDDAALAALEHAIIAGLPGAEGSHDRAGLRAEITRFAGLGPDGLRANLTAFHKRIVPLARELGLRLAIHPDDPPFPLFGLARVVSTPGDLAALFGAVPEVENGLTFCAGSFGARADNDLPAMLAEHAGRVHFAHLRNVAVEADGSFSEAEHLGGDADMVGLVRQLLAEEARRRAEGRTDADIPFRPDHGHLLLDDQKKTTQPGYSAIGRLKGLAELRGVIAALARAA